MENLCLQYNQALPVAAAAQQQAAAAAAAAAAASLVNPSMTNGNGGGLTYPSYFYPTTNHHQYMTTSNFESASEFNGYKASDAVSISDCERKIVKSWGDDLSCGHGCAKGLNGGGDGRLG